MTAVKSILKNISKKLGLIFRSGVLLNINEENVKLLPVNCDVLKNLYERQPPQATISFGSVRSKNCDWYRVG